MTSAVVTEVRALLLRLIEKAGAEVATLEFTMNRSGRLAASIMTNRGDGADRYAEAELPDATPAETRAGPLAYPRRVTLQLQGLEDAILTPAPPVTP